MKNKKYIVKAIIAFVFTVFVIGIFAGASFLLNFALNPVSPEKSPDSPKFIQADYDYTATFANMSEETAVQIRESYDWIKNNAEVISIYSHDGLALNAFKLVHKEPVHNYMIVMHGYKANVLSMALYVKHLYDAGYNVIAPGQRGHGWSEGNYIDMGINARYDVTGWILYVNHLDPDAKIGLYGVSMGAATIMMATGLDLADNVIVAVEDCGYTSVNNIFKNVIHSDFHLPAFPLVNTASLMCKLKYGFFFGEGNPKKAVANSKIPTLFIHGTKDTFVPFKMHGQLYKAASCPKQALAVDGAVHSRSLHTNTELYWSTVDKFLDGYFNSASIQEEASSK